MPTKPVTKRVLFKSEFSELSRLRKEVTDFIKGILSPIDMNRVLVSLDEAMTNIIEHGYKMGEGEIKLTLIRSARQLKFIFEDRARPFDPTGRKPPDLKKHFRSGREGGLGVFIYTTIMDVKHETLKSGGNRLTLIKRLSSRNSRGGNSP